MSEFVHLHVHSHHSQMDGLNTGAEIMTVAKGLGQTAIAVTDHGTLSSHREWQIEAKKEGIKPILGLEAYISPTDRFDRRSVKKRDDHTQNYHHIILLAKNAEGLENLNHMSREAWTSGFYSKPRIDWELLDEFGDGIIVLSGCLNGLVAKAIENDQPDVADMWMERLSGRFGDDFYIEVQPHNPKEINDGLFAYAEKYGVQCVATADCHFTRPELRWVEEALLILSTSPKESGKSYKDIKDLDWFDKYNALRPDRPISFEHLDVYVMSREEIEEAFKEAGYDRTDIFDNSVKIAEKVEEYPFVEGEDFLPHVSDEPNEELREKVMQGLKERGLVNSEYIERADEELGIISAKNFSPYFLIVEDIVTWAKSNGIRVGYGRGSAAGALVCYALGITDIDPIKEDLLFFRFIDESRDDWPDIDIDFPKSRRHEVKEYIRERYGHVASISNFVYFKDKQVIKDAAKVLGVSNAAANKATKPVETWEDFVASNHEDVVAFREKYPDVVELASQLRGRIRNVSLHAAGVVTSNRPIEDFAPFETRSDPSDKGTGRVPVVAWDMDTCAEVGLIKLDILGLVALDIIDDAIRFIKENHGVDIDEQGIPLDDPNVYRMLSEGHSVGVFQADTQAYSALLKDLQVSDFEDLVASNALIRPGAMNTVGTVFKNRKHGRERVEYAHPLIRDFTENTYGTIVYQEQVMLAATELGGLSKSESNKLRKIIGKKRDVAEFEQYKEKFLAGASEHITRAEAEKLWSDFEAHAGYSFNRSHAVAYSRLSYETAWLKYYYPLEFMTAVFRHEGEKDKKPSIFIEMKRLGLKVKTPHVNLSQADATVEDGAMRLGLKDIKGVADASFAAIENYRPFKSYRELLDLMETKGNGITTSVIGALNNVGAASFDDNPTGDIGENLFECLRVPLFDYVDLPPAAESIITPIEFYEEEGSFIVKGMVTGLKRGKTNNGKRWMRVEMVDETGVQAIFADPDWPIEKGQMYLFFVAWHQVMEFLPVGEIYEDGLLQKFLGSSTGPKIGEDEVLVLSLEKRKTAKGLMMGTILVCDRNRQLLRLLVFPKTFPSVYSKIKPGKVIKPVIKSLRDGGFHLDGIRR